jgi:hypothetical protein
MGGGGEERKGVRGGRGRQEGRAGSREHQQRAAAAAAGGAPSRTSARRRRRRRVRKKERPLAPCVDKVVARLFGRQGRVLPRRHLRRPALHGGRTRGGAEGRAFCDSNQGVGGGELDFAMAVQNSRMISKGAWRARSERDRRVSLVMLKRLGQGYRTMVRVVAARGGCVVLKTRRSARAVLPAPPPPLPLPLAAASSAVVFPPPL